MLETILHRRSELYLILVPLTPGFSTKRFKLMIFTYLITKSNLAQQSWLLKKLIFHLAPVVLVVIFTLMISELVDVNFANLALNSSSRDKSLVTLKKKTASSEKTLMLLLDLPSQISLRKELLQCLITWSTKNFSKIMFLHFIWPQRWMKKWMDSIQSWPLDTTIRANTPVIWFGIQLCTSLCLEFN